MRVYELLEYVDELQENVFSDRVKLRWINQLEAEIQVEVLLLAIDGIVQYSTEDREAELLVPPPYDRLYSEYLFWQIALAQGEAERANNQAEVYNKAYTDYVRFVARTINPGDGFAQKRQYYLSVYQIAVKHGFRGTEQEWLAQLSGPPGEPGLAGKDGRDGGYYMPAVSAAGDLTWTPSKTGMQEVPSANIKGPKGETGSDFAILGYYASTADLQAAHPTPQEGDAYGVGTEDPYDIYIWDAEHQEWVNNGPLFGATAMGAELVEITLPASGWVDQAQTIRNDAFAAAGYGYTVAASPASRMQYAACMVWANDVTVDGEITFQCGSTPEEDLTVRIMIIRVDAAGNITQGGSDTGHVSSTQISRIEVLDQAEYEALEIRPATTLYIVRG